MAEKIVDLQEEGGTEEGNREETQLRSLPISDFDVYIPELGKFYFIERLPHHTIRCGCWL